MLDSGEEDSGEEYAVDSETGEIVRAHHSKYSATDNDEELVREGWIVPDDYISDSDDEHSSLQ